jgi:hypothetical protein
VHERDDHRDRPQGDHARVEHLDAEAVEQHAAEVEREREPRPAGDAQARRDLQNEETAADGADGLEGLRADKEDQVGVLKVVLHESEAFITDHLLSMMGLPDFVGDVAEILGEISEEELQILVLALEEEDSKDQTYWIDHAVVDMIEINHLNAGSLITMLRAAIGDSEGSEIAYVRT